jgi:hypothetical protein
MIFQPFTEEELCLLEQNRNRFPTAAAIGRGGLFQPWRRGTMQGMGSRMPNGGRPGDTYTVYPGMEIRENVDQVRKLFRLAKVSSVGHRQVYKELKSGFQDIEMALAKVAPYSRTVVQGLRNDSMNCNSLGLLGVTAYYCWNYTAPLHRDFDHGWSVSVQIRKTSKRDEYNFAYADWGHYLETCTNCLWYVKLRS